MAAEAKYRITAQDRTKRGTDSARKNFKGLDGQLKGMMGSLKAVPLLVAGAAVAWKAWGLASTAARLQDVRSAYNSLASSVGQDAGQMLADMKAATAGTMDELELMQKFNEAAMLGVPMEIFAEGLEIARVAAKNTGKSVDFMVASFVTGMARMSTRIIDNLGITMSLSEAEVAYAEHLGKTTKELNAAEKAASFSFLAMQKGRKIVSDAGGAAAGASDDFARLKAESKNAGHILGELLVPGARKAAGWLADGARAAGDFLDKLRPLNREFRDWLAGARADEDPEKSLQLLRDEVERLNGAIADTEQSLVAIWKATGGSRGMIGAGLESQLKSLRARVSEINSAIFGEEVELRKKLAAEAETGGAEKLAAEKAAYRESQQELRKHLNYLAASVGVIPQIKIAIDVPEDMFEGEDFLGLPPLPVKVEKDEAEEDLTELAEFAGTAFDTMWNNMFSSADQFGQAMQSMTMNLIGQQIKAVVMGETTKTGAALKGAAMRGGVYAKEMAGGMRSAGVSIYNAAAKMWSAYAGLPFIGQILAAGGVAAMLGALGKLKPRAEGGFFDAGDRMLVGERGPEVIQMHGGGEVVPNHQLAGASAGPSIVVNIAQPVFTDDEVSLRNFARAIKDKLDEL